MSWIVFAVSALALVTVASAGCSDPQWITNTGMKVASSVADNSGNASVEACQGVCLTKLNCVAVDYTTDGQCLLTSDASAEMVADANVNHYTAQRTCEEGGITCVYKSIGQFQFQGENIYMTSNTSDINDCVAGCTNSPCTGFAWNPFGEFNCIKSSQPVSDKVAATIYTMLEKGDCTGSCEPAEFEEEADKVSADNTRNAAGDQSAFACGLQCLATEGCVSMDYTNSNECYIQTNADAALSDQAGTTHYTVEQDCDASGAMSTILGNKMSLVMQVAVILAAIVRM